MKKTMQYALDSLQKPVNEVITLMKEYQIFLLYGDIGSGKTTFMRSLLTTLGVTEAITSPTFIYVNEYYSSVLQVKIYHFDLYRLTSLNEFYELGLDSCFTDESAFMFFEWPELLDPVFRDKKVCRLYFQYIPDLEKRELVIKPE